MHFFKTAVISLFWFAAVIVARPPAVKSQPAKSAGGRLHNAEVTRQEHYREGRVPLHTLRTDIDYGKPPGTFGMNGVKVLHAMGEIKIKTK
jgi:small subunit ribosomal protein S3